MRITSTELTSGQRFPLRYSLFRQDESWLAQLQELASRIPLPAAIGPPDPSKKAIDVATADKLRALAESRFLWKAGRWKIECSGMVAGSRLTRVSTFELTEQKVTEMRAILTRYQSGIGVLNVPDYKFWQRDGVNPSARVQLTPESR